MPTSRQRRAAERRRLHRQSLRRREAVGRDRRINIAVSLAGALVAAGLVIALLVATRG